MSLPRKMTVKCSKCGKPLTATVFESVNSDYADDIAIQIMSGELFKVKCPHCQFVSHLEYDFLYHDLKNGAMIWVVHKNAPNYASKISEIRSTQKLPYKTLRIVEDMNALKEKVSCLERKRDDRIIELCKVFTAYNLLSKHPDFELRNAFYTAISRKDMIHLYDNDGNDMCCELSDKVYDYLKELYENSPYAAQFDDNYAIVDYTWAEQILIPMMKAEAERNNTATEGKPADPEAIGASESKIICTQCNSEIPEGSEFCQYCGSKIAAYYEQSKTPEVLVTPADPAVTIKPQEVESVKQQNSSYSLDIELGLVPNKPIYTNGVDQQRHYLQCLRSIDGETLKWNRRGSINIDGVQGFVDIYDAYLPSGVEYRTVYLNANGRATQTVAPKGFSFVSVPYVSVPITQLGKSKKPSKGKKIAKVVLIAAAIFTVLAICLAVAIPEFNYRQACQKLDNGKYDAAYLDFKDLGSYRDSEAMLDECIYQNACSKLDSEEYETAIELFESLNGYSDSHNKVNQAMYSYVLRHKNNFDTTTFDYLKKLKKQDYKDSNSIYENLYAWEITVFAINSSETDTITKQSSISRYNAVYFHFRLTGGEPNASVRLTAKPQYPDGDTSEYTFDKKWTDGETGWYGWNDGIYGHPEYGATGTLQCKFYDDEGNLIGMASVRITD